MKGLPQSSLSLIPSKQVDPTLVFVSDACDADPERAEALLPLVLSLLAE